MECLKKLHMINFIMSIFMFFFNFIMNLMKKYNLEVFDVKKLKTHGGSMRYFIKENPIKI